MDNIWDYVGFDRTKIDRALEEAGRQMRQITVYIIHES